MRKFFTLCLLCFSFGLFAQTSTETEAAEPSASEQSTSTQPHEFCKVEFTPEQTARLKAFQASGAMYRSSATEYDVPIKIHIVGSSTGTGYYRLDHLFTQMCELNEQYDSTDIHFYLKGDINYLDNTDWYDHDWFDGRTMMNSNNFSDVVNMYMVENPADNCGYYSGFSDAVAVAKSCAVPGATTIAHELGHFFSLPHTFDGYDPARTSTWERVDGSNCTWVGDGFCDTPPDYIPGRWSCPSGTYTDPVGDNFTIDGSYFMSYANDACQNRHSNQQIAAIRYNLTNYRPRFLSAHTAPPRVSMSSVDPIFPADGETDIKLNFQAFHWTTESNATAYHLIVSRFSSFGNPVIDVMLSDTSYVAMDVFTPGRKYYWKVKPIHPSNTCASYSTTRSFEADGGFTGINESYIEKHFKMLPNPAASGQTLDIEFPSEGGEISLRIFDLQGKLLQQETIESVKGMNVKQIDLSQISKGLKIISLEGSDFSISKKLQIH